ncbi:MAG: 3-oxoacid CoA-transferase subunit A [Dehalococcoidia bacterium]|jgi:3-oxoacid CoA-transferase subunit A|nr:3-oxoacid CoA-transferase subunit A [Dehalococcoidia bacterium]
MPGTLLNPADIARRAAKELFSGAVAALGPGIPCYLPGELPSNGGVWFLADSGALGIGGPESGSSAVDAGGNTVSLLAGGAYTGVVDIAGILRGGHTDIAFLQPSQVAANGDFVHWTTEATEGLFAPGPAVDMAYGAATVVAVMPHQYPGGRSNIVEKCSLPVDGPEQVEIIITDAAVLKVGPAGLELLELAPGWTAEEIEAITDAPLKISSGLKEMTFQAPTLEPPNKVYSSAMEALEDVPEGSTINVDGFAGPGGMAHYLMVGLRDVGVKGLQLISNTAGVARVSAFGAPNVIDHSILVENNQVAKATASYPVSPSASRPSAFEEAFNRRETELEVVPQGTLAEKLRCGGAGVAAFYTPTGAGTLLADGKEARNIGGKEYILETGLRADFCIIRGHKADTLGNVVYKGTSRNFNPVMATTARITVVEVDEIVEPGQLGPEEIITPGLYIDRIVLRPPDFSAYL